MEFQSNSPPQVPAELSDKERSDRPWAGFPHRKPFGWNLIAGTLLLARGLVSPLPGFAQEAAPPPSRLLAKAPRLATEAVNSDDIPPAPAVEATPADPDAGINSLDTFALSSAVPPSPLEPGSLTADLVQRLESVEQQLRQRQEADKKAAATAAKKFTVRPFGRVHFDAATFNQDRDNKLTVGECHNGVDLRRARLGVEGEGFGTFFYRFDMDFVTFDQGSNGSQSSRKRPSIFDAYLDTQNLPVLGNLRVGQFREPFSLDRLDSTNDMPFLERSNPVNALVPFRNVGVMAFDVNESETRTWSYGLFAENSNEFGEQLSDRTGLAFTARSTWLPWFEENSDGDRLLHLGASYSYRRVNRQLAQFGTTPEFGLKHDSALGLLQTPRFVNTPLLHMDHYNLVGVEATTMFGSLAVQAEYIALFGDQIGQPNLFFHGGYVEAMYWLTGEQRNYNRQLGIHGPVTPRSNFYRTATGEGIQTGPGAWEATARISNLDLDSRNIHGGRIVDVTLGLNWYYAVRSRVMLNYVHSFLDRNGLDSNADILAIRYQWAF